MTHIMTQLLSLHVQAVTDLVKQHSDKHQAFEAKKNGFSRRANLVLMNAKGDLNPKNSDEQFALGLFHRTNMQNLYSVEVLLRNFSFTFGKKVKTGEKYCKKHLLDINQLLDEAVQIQKEYTMLPELLTTAAA